MDLIKIYTFCIITLALFLAALTWYLLSKKSKLEISKVKQLNRVYVFVLFFMIVFMLLIMIEFYQGPQITLTNSANYQINIPETVESESIKNAPVGDKRFYVDPNHAFFISFPETTGWVKPQIMNGFLAYLQKTGLETKKTNVESFLRWNPYKEVLQCIFRDLKMNPYEDMMKCLDRYTLNSPYGNMLKMSLSTVFEYGTSLNIQVRLDSSPPFQFQDTVQQKSFSDSLPEDQFTTMIFDNYLNITILDKSAIPDEDNRLTLANYFLKNTINLSSNAEKIIASENNMLFTSTFEFEKVIHNGTESKLHIHRWVRMIEEPGKLYILEMVYSPDTDPGSSIWTGLKSMFESFTILHD